MIFFEIRERKRERDWRERERERVKETKREREREREKIYHFLIFQKLERTNEQTKLFFLHIYKIQNRKASLNRLQITWRWFRLRVYIRAFITVREKKKI